MSERDFPPDFLWGSSTAAHQVEGGNVANDWWAWEHTPGSTAIEPSGDAIDHYHRYDADFALLASLGQGAHRFSWSGPGSSRSRGSGRPRHSIITGVCWSRCMPTGWCRS